ncbi:hypothetical protein ABHN05_19355, partial [Brevibacillus laterosporus]
KTRKKVTFFKVSILRVTVHFYLNNFLISEKTSNVFRWQLCWFLSHHQPRGIFILPAKPSAALLSL